MYNSLNKYLLLVFITQQKLVGTLAVMLVVFDFCLGIHMMCHRGIMRKHTTTKSEKPRATATGNMHKNIGEVQQQGFHVI